ncbi:MAG: glycosyltransferase family 39 protein [Dehalococcoidia bacterium]
MIEEERGARAAAAQTAARAAARERLTLAAIAALAFAVRLAWILYTNYTPTLRDDAGRYDLLGRSLAHAAGYVNPNGTTTLFWPPGYPFILAAVYRLFDDSVRAALVLNALLAAATVVLVYAIGRRAFAGRAAMLGALLYALMPSAVFFAGVTLSETTFTFVLLLAIWLIVESAARRSWRLLVAAGVAVGYAALIRGQAALIPLVALPFWLWSAGDVATGERRGDGGAASGAPTGARHGRREVRAALLRTLVLGAVAAAVIAPWTVRNYVESGSPVLISTNAGVDFYIGHSASADGRGRIVNELVFRYPNLSEPRAEARVSNDGFREGLKYIVHHPLREVSLSARKVFWLYENDHEALQWIDGHGERRVLPHGVKLALGGLSDVYYWLLIALALIGVRRWLTCPRGIAGATRLLLVSLVAYWTLVHVAFFADPRFHAPITPVLCLWAAVGAIAVMSKVRGAAQPKRSTVG